VLADASEVEQMARRIRHRWRPVRASDYRDDPRETGYRALHLIVEKRVERYSTELRPVEIQLRTENEHRWAEAVARLLRGRVGRRRV
jgi:ppGpp synthetase/RelA/SpoT-type nucleotidyltranferase